MAVKAALLDERGVYLRVDELEDASQLTARHLPQILACDLPPGRYVWIPDERKRPDGTAMNEYDGAFWDLAWLQRVAATRDKAHGVSLAKGLAYQSRSPEHDRLVEFLRTHKLERT